MRAALVAFLLFAAAGTAGAQAIYRCGTVYSQSPCDGAVTVASAPERSAADASRASTQAQRDMKMANEMERARLQQEARAPKAVILPEPKGPNWTEDKPQTGKKMAKGEKFKHFTAVSGAPQKKAKTKS